MAKRTRQICLRLTDEEHKRLTRVADELGVGRQNAIRFMLKRELDRIINLRALFAEKHG